MRHIPSIEINWRNLSDEELLRTVRANESWMGIPLVETLVQRLEKSTSTLSGLEHMLDRSERR